MRLSKFGSLYSPRKYGLFYAARLRESKNLNMKRHLGAFND